MGSEFYEKLTALTSKELAEIRKTADADRAGAMVENIARILGFTVAVLTKGDAEGIDRMIAGAEAYAMEEAVEKSKFARVMG